MAELLNGIRISAAALKAQAQRMRTVAENLANASSTSKTPGGDPYRRKTITFSNELDRALNAKLVRVKTTGTDKSDFIKKYEPGHPAADANGYVSYPNVNPVIETMDMREAQRSYEANLSAIDLSKSMLMKTIDMLRA